MQSLVSLFPHFYMYFMIWFLRPYCRFRSPSWASTLQLSSPLCPGWFCTHAATLGKPFLFFFFHPEESCEGYYTARVELTKLFFCFVFPASSMFSFTWLAPRVSHKVHVAQYPIRGGELKAKRERQGRMDRRNKRSSLAFPAWWVFIFLPWVFSRLFILPLFSEGSDMVNITSDGNFLVFSLIIWV